VPSYLRAELGKEYGAAARRAAATLAAKLRTDFEHACGQAGLPGFEFQTTAEEAVSALVRFARYADLLVIGQRDPTEEHSSVEEGQLAASVALACGRPVLVAPFAGPSHVPPRRVLVAWSSSRESMRAVTDALPLLRGAEKVTVLSVNAPDTDADAPVAGAACAHYLARHGITVEASSDAGIEIDVGNYLLSRAADLSADLIVMGAYGHSRMREWALGGVTRTMLQHMTVPVLLSH
jgi:nucleotide-binding universal stress UspA family protein